VALAVFLLAIGHGAPLFVVALLFVGLGNLGWGAELLPRQMKVIAAGGILQVLEFAPGGPANRP
jgi:hypothetical protein